MHRYFTMNTKSILALSAVAVALALLVAPLAASDVSASHGDSLRQQIIQSQESEQESQVTSGGNTEASGNNFNEQTQTNEGSNTATQD